MPSCGFPATLAQCSEATIAYELAGGVDDRQNPKVCCDSRGNVTVVRGEAAPGDIVCEVGHQQLAYPRYCVLRPAADVRTTARFRGLRSVDQPIRNGRDGLRTLQLALGSDECADIVRSYASYQAIGVRFSKMHRCE